MTYVTLSEEYFVSPGDQELVLLDCSDHLGSETIASVTCVDNNSTSLTISTVQATTATTIIKGRSITAAQAASAFVYGFVSGSTHELLWTVVSSGAPARTFKRLTRMITK